MVELKPCPFCGRKDAVTISVCDDEGNYHGEIGCDYEQDPWSGLSYALAHEGWGRCILCTDNEPMGGILFDTAEDAAEAWNRMVVEVRRGEWLPDVYAKDTRTGYEYLTLKCSVCGCGCMSRNNFCHRCGADMRGGR